MKDATISKAAQAAPTSDLDHFPPLIIHRCLGGDGRSVLEKAIKAHFSGELAFFSEVVSFPRRGFAPRPVEILSVSALAAYKALVEHLAPSLPEPSRTHGAWAEHQSFGTTAAPNAYVVDIDYTACYELIDHENLKDELLLRAFDTVAISNLDRLLSAVGRRGRGLPQMLAESDLLADTYLSVIDRALERRGYALHRYADDVRIIVSSWTSALQVIAEAADLARNMGLLLSSAKTSVRLSATLVEKEAEVLKVLTDRLDDNLDQTAANWITQHSNPYEDDDDDDTESVQDTSIGEVPDGADARQAAYLSILQAWHEQFGNRERPEQSSTEAVFGPHLNVALNQARTSVDALDPALLSNLVFEDEARMEHVAKYLVARFDAHGVDAVSEAVALLIAGDRHSNWSELWLLDVVGSIWNGSAPPQSVLAWARKLLGRDKEVVRAQAAWTLARMGVLTADDLKQTYLSCSPLSAPALSAAAGLQSKSAPTFADRKLILAIRQDSDLNRKAFEWAQL